MNKEERLNDLYDYFWWINNKIGNKLEIDKDLLNPINKRKYKTPTMSNIITAMNWIEEKDTKKAYKILLEKGKNRELYISILYESEVIDEISSEYMVYKNNVSFRCLLD